jgi:hypothetical protein
MPDVHSGPQFFIKMSHRQRSPADADLAESNVTDNRIEFYDVGRVPDLTFIAQWFLLRARPALKSSAYASAAPISRPQSVQKARHPLATPPTRHNALYPIRSASDNGAGTTV